VYYRCDVEHCVPRRDFVVIRDTPRCMRALVVGVVLTVVGCSERLVGDTSPDCVPPVVDGGAQEEAGPCTLGDRRCSETGMVEQCSADGISWEAVEQCVGPAFCDGDMGRCTAEPRCPFESAVALYSVRHRLSWPMLKCGTLGDLPSMGTFRCP
jgi:hypothetical protein